MLTEGEQSWHVISRWKDKVISWSRWLDKFLQGWPRACTQLRKVKKVVVDPFIRVLADNDIKAKLSIANAEREWKHALKEVVYQLSVDLQKALFCICMDLKGEKSDVLCAPAKFCTALGARMKTLFSGLIVQTRPGFYGDPNLTK